MSRRSVGLLLLLLCSVGLGIGFGHWFSGVFDATVPPAVLTQFNHAAAYSYFLFRGLVIGLVIFIWSVAVILLARFFTPEVSDADI